MPALNEQELAELKALEADEAKEAAEADAAFQRQRLEAKRARKRHAGKLGEFGRDFTVVMTTAGNWVMRRCHDVALDALGANPEDRGAQEEFLIGITVEPAKDEAQKLLAEFPGLVGVLIPEALKLVGQVRKEEAKK